MHLASYNFLSTKLVYMHVNMCVFVYMRVCVYVRVSVCLPLRLLVNNGVMWCDMNSK